MAHIDYWLSTISPWCYLAGDRLEQIAARHGAQVHYRPVDILALYARVGGVPMQERHPVRNAYRAQELHRWSRTLDMPFNLQPKHFPANTAPSSYAVIAAQKDGRGDTGALVRHILTAVWAGERNISDDEVIRDCLTRAGFDGDLVNSGLLVGAETYARNLEDAIEAGAFGVPFYTVRETGERFWGQDRLDMLDAYLGTL